MVVVVLFTAGDHVPGIPSLEGVGNVNGSPEHIGPGLLNVGSIFEFTIIVPVAFTVPHPPVNGML